MLRLYDERELPRTAALGNLGADPLGTAARSGGDDLAGPLAAAAGLAVQCAREYPGLRALTVDALPYHEAGGSAAQELGASLATGVAYLRALTDAGLTVEEALAQLEFRYAATADQFLTIAKLRAARRLWARVAEVSGGAPAAGAQRQHAVTSSVMMTRRDPWVNMLRTTVACLGAGVGGADAVTVLPFDHALGLPDAFARRIARNTSTILLEESPPGPRHRPGGRLLVRGAAHRRTRPRRLGVVPGDRARRGQAAALRSGLVAERLAATWEDRRADLAARREPITGVSEFPHLGEEPVHRDPAPAAPAGGLPVVRRDEAYEELRTRSDAHLAATGDRPRAFLAALGPAAAHTGRLTFAANLFQAGGIEPVPCTAPETPRGVRRGVRRQRRHRGLPVLQRHAVRRARRSRRRRPQGSGRPAGVPRGQTGGAARSLPASRSRRVRLRGRRRGRRPLHRPRPHGSGVMRIPDFSGIELGPAQRRPRRPRPVAHGAEGEHRPPRRGPGLGDPRGHRRQAAVHRRGSGRRRLPGHLSGHRALPARPLPDDVRQPALDHPAVRGLLHRRGVQRLLPPQPRG
ncbi:hypothetical protein GCM10020000_69740 [Streptomyces olivoverticillatus]